MSRYYLATRDDGASICLISTDPADPLIASIGAALAPVVADEPPTVLNVRAATLVALVLGAYASQPDPPADRYSVLFDAAAVYRDAYGDIAERAALAEIARLAVPATRDVESSQ